MIVDQALSTLAILNIANRFCRPTIAGGNTFGALGSGRIAHRFIAFTVVIVQATEALATGSLTDRLVSTAIAIVDAGHFALMVSREAGPSFRTVFVGAALFTLPNYAYRFGTTTVIIAETLDTTIDITTSMSALPSTHTTIIAYVIIITSDTKLCCDHYDEYEQRDCIEKRYGFGCRCGHSPYLSTYCHSLL